MNEYDTQLVRSILAKAGYAFVSDELGADIVMLNTCAIREHAHRKVYGRVHEIRHRRREAAQNELGPRGPNPPLIGILGCMATNLRTDLLENRNLKIDFIAGPDSYKRLPDLIREAGKTGEKPFDLTLSEFETYSDVFPDQHTNGDSPRSGTPPTGANAWIAVMRGCNNFCTFCVVPYTRGRERSRSVDNVVAEARQLAQSGFKQVTLLGQNVNSYHHDGADFADLLEAVSGVEGIERIRYTSPHPKDFPVRLLKVMAENPKICKHIHLPLQAGSDRVLEEMNRTYTRREFLDLVGLIRKTIPGVALSTDIIVGFPTETDAEFEETLAVMREVEFDSAFMFKYSERKGTIASRKLSDDVPEAIKTERIVRLVDLQKEASLRRNKAEIGQILEVLIEKIGTPRSDEECLARTDGNKRVILPREGRQIGERLSVRITDATHHTLKGAPVPRGEPALEASS